MRKAVVVGAGIGGLSAALQMRSRGWEVTVLEKEPTVGGKAAELYLGPWRFDIGPSLLTMPEVFDQLWADLGERREDRLSFVFLDPITRYWFDDGSKLAGRPLPAFYEELEQSLGVAPVAAEAWFDYAKDQFELTQPIFLRRPLDSLRTWLSRDAFRAYGKLARLDLSRTMAQAVESRFSDPRLRQYFERYATYNGSDPWRAPAILNGIGYLEHGLGAYGVRGGIYGLVRGLTELALRHGVEIRTEHRVQQIDQRGGAVAGVRGVHGASAFSLAADALIANVDPQTVYRDFLGEENHPKMRKQGGLEPSSSGLVYCWGIRGRSEELGLHNIFFSGNYREEFRDIHERGLLPRDPTVYLNISSKIDAQDAPEDGENWFVLVNAPAEPDYDWEELASRYRTRVLERLRKALGRDFEASIEVEHLLHPRSIQDSSGSLRGALYGSASNSRRAAFLRHPNRVADLAGLYLCGGSVHPGGGMPLVALSGMIAAQLADDDKKLRRENVSAHRRS